MDLKIILALVLGLYQALDTRGFLSSESKDNLSIALMIFGGIPLVAHILQWIFGKGPKIQPIYEGLLKIILMDFYEPFNNYLYLRNKGPYCSEVMRCGYFLHAETWVIGSDSDLEYGETVSLETALNYRVKCFSKKGLAVINSNALKTNEVKLEDVLKKKEVTMRCKIGSLKVRITSNPKKVDECGMIMLYMRKQYADSSQVFNSKVKIKPSQFTFLIYLLSIRGDNEILLKPVFSNWRKAEVAHSMNILELIEFVKDKELTGFRLSWEPVSAFIEGKLACLELTDYDKVLKNIDGNLYKLMSAYFDLMGYSSIVRLAILKWFNKGCLSNITTRFEGLKNWSTKRAIVDVQAILIHLGLSAKIFHDLKIKPRASLMSLLKTVPEGKSQMKFIVNESTNKLYWPDIEFIPEAKNIGAEEVRKEVRGMIEDKTPLKFKKFVEIPRQTRTSALTSILEKVGLEEYTKFCSKRPIYINENNVITYNNYKKALLNVKETREVQCHGLIQSQEDETKKRKAIEKISLKRELENYVKTKLLKPIYRIDPEFTKLVKEGVAASLKSTTELRKVTARVRGDFSKSHHLIFDRNKTAVQNFNRFRSMHGRTEYSLNSKAAEIKNRFGILAEKEIMKSCSLDEEEFEQLSLTAKKIKEEVEDEVGGGVRLHSKDFRKAVYSELTKPGAEIKFSQKTKFKIEKSIKNEQPLKRVKLARKKVSEKSKMGLVSTRLVIGLRESRCSGLKRVGDSEKFRDILNSFKGKMGKEINIPASNEL